MTTIPSFLAHLERDRRGLPVPYVNAWGDLNGVDGWYLDADPYVGGRTAAFFRDDRAAGPNFLAQNPQRQREVSRLGRCQVCRRGVPWAERGLVYSSMSTQVVEIDRAAHVVISEPWLCPDCAVFAINVCPGLIRRKSADDLVLLTGFTEENCKSVLSEGAISGPLEAETRARPVAMWSKILVPALDRLGTAPPPKPRRPKGRRRW